MKDSLLFSLIVSALLAAYFGYLKTGPQSAAAASVGSAATRHAAEPAVPDVKAFDKAISRTERAVAHLSVLKTMPTTPAKSANPFRKSSEVDRDEMRRDTLQALQTLQLQSILCTDGARSCTINNASLTEGQQINDFTVERITPTSVTVHREAYRFQLTLSQ